LSETDAGHPLIDVRRCEGFAVNGPDGRIGTAVDARVDPGTDLPTAMTVRTGLLSDRRGFDPGVGPASPKPTPSAASPRRRSPVLTAASSRFATSSACY